jgi:hypothetical protein
LEESSFFTAQHPAWEGKVRQQDINTKKIIDAKQHEMALILLFS